METALAFSFQAGGRRWMAAAVEETFAELDDLIIQFRGTKAGDRFVEAWFNGRRVVDTGRRSNKPAPSTPADAPAIKAA